MNQGSISYAALHTGVAHDFCLVQKSLLPFSRLSPSVAPALRSEPPLKTRKLLPFDKLSRL